MKTGVKIGLGIVVVAGAAGVAYLVLGGTAAVAQGTGAAVGAGVKSTGSSPGTGTTSTGAAQGAGAAATVGAGHTIVPSGAANVASRAKEAIGKAGAKLLPGTGKGYTL